MNGTSSNSIDVLLVAADWRSRVLLRAQLIEAGFQVCATDSWSSARQVLLTVDVDGIVVVDLLDLPTPTEVLRELSALVSPARLVIIGAAGTVPVHALRSVATAVLCRPLRVGDVVSAIARALSHRDRVTAHA
jgi:DNA-binding NtrC family response regulator